MGIISINSQTLFSEILKDQAPGKQPITKDATSASDREPEKAPLIVEQQSTPVFPRLPLSLVEDPARVPVEPGKEFSHPTPLARRATGGDENKNSPHTQKKWKTVIVKKGDSLARLVADVYGQANKKNLKLVQKHNPQIKDVNSIEVGQKIIFPSP